MTEFIRYRTAGCVFVLVALSCAVSASAADTLAARLQALADRHDFRVEGVEKIGVEPAVSVQKGDLASELRRLLAGYNHVVEGVPPSVQRVIILGAKQAASPALVTVTTRHQGHHMVTADVQGVAGHRARVELMVDTGASTLVLPDSMIATLGFDGEALQERRGQTVNGMVTGRVARLARVAVGNAVVRDVAVLFVAADRLGGVSLLGMSFLDRFSITIDETTDKAGSRLVLTPR